MAAVISTACGALTGADDLTIVSDGGTLASKDPSTLPVDGGHDSNAPAPADLDAASDASDDSAVVDAAPDHAVTCTSVSAYPSNISELGLFSQWGNLPTISSTDGFYADCAISTSNSPTPSVFAADLRFSIPSNAVIQGVVATMVRRARNGGDVVDASMRLRWSGKLQGDDRSDPSAWSALKNTMTYGTETDVWGTALTPAIVNGPDFGVVFAAKWIVGNSGNDTVYIDSIQMTIRYCL
ncbi:hypothetical protein AKJ09_07212 [Labilithrix luteola]|uniref:Uncharacterized protein n=1 Tax=Labilithrix luteola TaxID=1391654 RepID=A0A0K1Q492_9BACT|nr:hypothetical protein AKJ09_07212 [Labilithrix luteola]